MSACSTCRWWSREQLSALTLNTGWMGKRVLTDAESAGGLCLRAERPLVSDPDYGCPAYRPRGFRIVLRLLVAILFPWGLLWWYSRRAKEGLDRLARSRDDALVCRSALHAVWSSLVELFHESGADLRVELSSDEEGNKIGRHNPEPFYKGFYSYAHRTHARVGLQIKRLVQLRGKCPDVDAAIEPIDVGRPDIPMRNR